MAKPRKKKKKPIRIQSGPATVKWIKIVNDPIDNDKRVYFETSDGTKPHGHFVLEDDSSQAAANRLIEAMIYGLEITYTTHPDPDEDTDYDFTDTYTRNGVIRTPVIVIFDAHELTDEIRISH